MRFDSIDLAIINVLRKDARSTFKEIAEKLGISTSTAQARFKKMEEAGLIKGSMIIPNFNKTGTYITQMGIKTINPQTRQVVEYIRELKLPNAAIYCWEGMGHYNIFCWIFIKDPIKMHTIKHMIQQHPAVIEVNASLITELNWHYNNCTFDHILKGKNTNG